MANNDHSNLDDMSVNGFTNFEDLLTGLTPEDTAPAGETLPEDGPLDGVDFDFDPADPELPSEPAAEDLGDLDTYEDSGVFRSFDGNREFRSFDAAMPEASPDEWYRYSASDEELDEGAEVFSEDPDPREKRKKGGKKRSGWGVFGKVLLTLVTLGAACYLIFIYSSIPIISTLRTTYIETAMSTINHKWLATCFIPSEIIDNVMLESYQVDAAAMGVESDWGSVQVEALPEFQQTTIEAPVASGQPTVRPEISAPSGQEADLDPEEETFYEMFWELDRTSARAYFDSHPDALKYGWAWVDINESGLSDSGTGIYTIYGDEVLAINAKDGVILIRVYLSSNNSRGVLAICADTSRLSLCPATTLGTIGQTCGTICDNNNGILAITGSAFMDDGTSNGGQISGLAVCSGKTYGSRLGGTDKRLEVRDDNKMYILDSSSALGYGTRDACEFRPALIIDGQVMLEDPIWNGINPRAALGQSSKLETMMIVVEGRYADSLGCSPKYVADKLAQYGCVQALNLDGGTSAMMYYKGQYVNRCSNSALPGGRTLPTAWVYKPAW